MADPYETLGVARGSERPVIREAYLALARRFHPDQLGAAPPATRAAAESRMREVNEAWAVLGDPRRRAEYDAGQGAEEARPPVVRPKPAGSGWRPRADDTGWMDDFETWKYATDHLLDDEDEGAPRPLLVVLPVVMGVASLLLGCLGLVLNARPLMAGAVGGIACAVVAFFLLPIVVMTAERGARDRRN